MQPMLVRSAGYPDCISLDMGGTSTDVALIRGGQPLITNEGSFEDYPLNVPMIDVRTIGAGGSSIAYVDEGGALKVGPESAGADPGPACYGRAGSNPTVTDASLVLGYLNPATFAGGLDIDVEKSRETIEKQIAEPLNMTLSEAALGIHAIVNSNMAQNPSPGFHQTWSRPEGFRSHTVWRCWSSTRWIARRKCKHQSTF